MRCRSRRSIGDVVLLFVHWNVWNGNGKSQNSMRAKSRNLQKEELMKLKILKFEIDEHVEV
jgi:hypothetical protein